MSMSKKDFIALADVIKSVKGTPAEFHTGQIAILAAFCQSQNSNFMRGRWEDYITGRCGPNGGKI